jgi:hypothetical protein
MRQWQVPYQLRQWSPALGFPCPGYAANLECSNQLPVVHVRPQPDFAHGLVRRPAAIIALPLVNVLQEVKAHCIRKCWCSCALHSLRAAPSTTPTRTLVARRSTARMRHSYKAPTGWQILTRTRDRRTAAGMRGLRRKLCSR